jgi:hypothetical protein
LHPIGAEGEHMSCQACEGLGLVPIVAADNPKPDGAIGVEDLHVAVCLCDAGRWYRSDVNAGRRTGCYGWQVWCAQHQVAPERVHRLEDVYPAVEAAALGLGRQPKQVSGEAALLAASKARKARL